MNNLSISQPINRLLSSEQIEAILCTLLINCPVRILRVIARTGKFAQSVSWVYIENEITEQRSSTFISFADLEEAFWAWLETVKLLALAVWQRIGISKAVWAIVPVGAKVHHRQLGWCRVVEKDLSQSQHLPRFWVEIDDRLEKVDPCQVYYLN
ncbi:MAG: hypothetical protein QNJ72_30560 [Pleurocapsa sp. MO_226.B13]|nr:hypothetical protein [Pleurocapsa sp. MO_226.B13]